jgi:tetratricopeptide (TPR) repeat protein
VPDAVAGAAEAFFNISSSLVRENSADMALVFGWLAVDLNPNLGQGLLLIAGIYETLNRYDDAIRVYGMVGTNSPWRWNAQIREALVNDAAERTDKSVALLRAMIAEQPARAEAATSLGDVLRGRKRFIEAVEAYDTAIARSNPSEQRNWTLYYSRGIALERATLWQRAEADFLKALELSPEQPHVLNYLGYSWVEHGVNLDRARKMLERAVELRPNDGYIVDSLGWVLFRTGDFKGATERLEHAVELRPQDATINDHLGDAYWKVGRHAEARFQWSRALSLDPEPELVDSIKTKLARGLQGVAAKRGG